METNIWGEDILDSKDYYDEGSVLFSDYLFDSSVLKTLDINGEVDNLEGGYYYGVNGEFLGKEGNSRNVFLANRVLKDIYDENNKIVGKEIVYINKTLLSINHADFTYCAGVILQEGKDYEELLFIAHTANNEAKFQSKSLKTILSSSYSTVPKEKKKVIIDKEDSKVKSETERKQLQLEKYARKAIIDVFNNGQDVSNGSQRWDGIDFIAWGMYHAPKQTSPNFRHQKFNQYGTIKISKSLFDQLKANSGSSVSYAKRKWMNPKNPGSYVFEIPEEVFVDENNWKNNEFSFSTNVNKLTLVATAVRSQTIYWKIVR